MLGRILSESSNFAIFGGGLEWFQNLSLEENVRFGIIKRYFFPNFGLDSAHIRPNLAKSIFDILAFEKVHQGLENYLRKKLLKLTEFKVQIFWVRSNPNKKDTFKAPFTSFSNVATHICREKHLKLPVLFQ